MGKAHEVAVGADAKPFDEAIRRGVIKPVEDAEKALKKFNDTDAGKDAARDVAKLEDELKDATRATEKLDRGMVDVGDSAKRGMDDASDGVRDFKSEANQTAKETAASFSGSADDIGGMFQELAANAFGGFGPAGAVAGLAAAAGLGVLFESWRADADAMEERTSSMYQAMLDEGVSYVTETIVQNGLVSMSEEDKAKARELAAQAGVDQEVARRALAGDDVAMLEIRTELEGKLKDANDRSANAAETRNANATRAAARERADIEGAIGSLDKYSESFGKASSDARITADAVGRIGLNAGEAESKARGLAQGLGNVPKDVSVRMVVDDSQVRNYRPPKLQIDAIVNPRTGRQLL